MKSSPPLSESITHARLLELLIYDPETGLFVRRVARPGRWYVGTVAGSRHKDGYTNIELDSISYLAHRLAWFYVTGNWPLIEIDHRNRSRSDNRFVNLREADDSDSACNQGVRIDNKSGQTGVYWFKNARKWRATIKRHGKCISLGYYKNLEDAIKARIESEPKYHGEFAQSVNPP